jgi:hypothetical protein
MIGIALDADDLASVQVGFDDQAAARFAEWANARGSNRGHVQALAMAITSAK